MPSTGRRRRWTIINTEKKRRGVEALGAELIGKLMDQVATRHPSNWA